METMLEDVDVPELNGNAAIDQLLKDIIESALNNWILEENIPKCIDLTDVRTIVISRDETGIMRHKKRTPDVFYWAPTIVDQLLDKREALLEEAKLKK